MKSIIVAFVFAIGLMVLWPPGEQVQAATSDQLNFAIDQQLVAPVAAMLMQNYLAVMIEKTNSVPTLVCRKGGDVEVRMFNLVTQPTNLLALKVNNQSTDFTQFYNYDFRLCRYTKQIENQITAENIESRTRCTIRADSQG